jgi:hypothetical protein
LRNILMRILQSSNYLSWIVIISIKYFKCSVSARYLVCFWTVYISVFFYMFSLDHMMS